MSSPSGSDNNATGIEAGVTGIVDQPTDYDSKSIPYSMGKYVSMWIHD